ncbi:protein FAM32A-like [Mya arenaria]|uniref:protein FAM32A-like n=1 Tax=Mya arenaria TaxID=6604 RepID=UPI0022E49AD6|nr:protein FAM32A-like [Mya arenaria]XP_052776256.1 protein FAM32A-like [Mya arenaria]
MSDYDNVCRGSLKLKGVSDHKIKKKKKKRDKIDKEVAQYLENIEAEASGSGEQKKREDRRTKAEIAFEKRKEKKMAEQIIEKATKSHKERIMEFNHHLDSLTEHFDIPKVSWTK